MPLTEQEFTTLVDAGCSCGHGELSVEALVVQRLELYRGDLLGSPTWGYKGEELVRGTFAIDCTRCKTTLYRATACCLCGAEGGVEQALESETDFPFAEACAACNGGQITASAYVPAKVVYGNGRAQKARSNVAPEDPGFHAFRLECKACHHTVSRRGACVLCGGCATPSAERHEAR